MSNYKIIFPNYSLGLKLNFPRLIAQNFTQGLKNLTNHFVGPDSTFQTQLNWRNFHPILETQNVDQNQLYQNNSTQKGKKSPKSISIVSETTLIIPATQTKHENAKGKDNFHFIIKSNFTRNETLQQYIYSKA